VLTFGAIGSHQALATTVCARAVGMRTQLVLVPQPVTDHVRRTLLLDHAHGAELHLASGMVHAATTTATLLARGALTGALPAIIPVGATSTLGTIGYVNAALELADQVRAGELPAPHTIFVALGSGGTIAGLVLGLKLADLHTRVVGVLVTDLLAPSTRCLARLARSTLAYLRRRAPTIPDVTVRPDDFTIVTSELGPGYGSSTPAAEKACRLMAESEGITLETTYTAKCLAAVLRLGQSSPAEERAGAVLFWNTFSAIEPEAPNGLPNPDDLPIAFRKFFD
jgi:D-cysteine desulfhydrase